MASLDDVLKKPHKSAGELKAILDQVNSSLRGVGDAFKVVNFDVTNFGGLVSTSGNALAGLFGLLPGVGDQLESFSKTIVGSVSGVMEFGGKVANLVDGIQRLSISFDRVSIQISQSFGRPLEDTMQILNKFSDTLLDVRSVTFASMYDIASQAKAMGQVFTEEELIATEPFDKASEAIYGATGKITAISSAFLVGKSVGLDFSNSIGIVNQMMERLVSANVSSTEKLEQSQRAMLALSEVSKRNGVSIGFVKNAVMGVTDTLSLYRNEGTSAATVMDGLTSSTSSFTDALTKVGVAGPRAVQFAGELTQSLSKVGLATRAFIAQSGELGRGRGALSAALQYERAIGEGDFSSIQRALTNMVERVGGGRVMTFQKAVEGGEGSARQFEVQRRVIMGQLGVGETQARRILDILDKTGPAGVAGIDTSKALEDAIKEGTQITNKTTTALDKTNIILSDILTKVTIGAERMGTDATLSMARMMLRTNENISKIKSDEGKMKAIEQEAKGRDLPIEDIIKEKAKETTMEEMREGGVDVANIGQILKRAMGGGLIEAGQTLGGIFGLPPEKSSRGAVETQEGGGRNTIRDFLLDLAPSFVPIPQPQRGEIPSVSLPTPVETSELSSVINRQTGIGQPLVTRVPETLGTGEEGGITSGGINHKTVNAKIKVALDGAEFVWNRPDIIALNQAMSEVVGEKTEISFDDDSTDRLPVVKQIFNVG